MTGDGGHFVPVFCCSLNSYALLIYMITIYLPGTLEQSEAHLTADPARTHNFCGDWSGKNFYDHSHPSADEEGLSVTDESMCTSTG